MASGRADLAADVATSSAIANASLLITQRESWVGDPSLLSGEDRNESLRWSILPSPMRLERADRTATVAHYGASGGVDRRYVATLGYVDGGWRVTSFVLPRIGGPG